jgi:hypothetical protein
MAEGNCQQMQGADDLLPSIPQERSQLSPCSVNGSPCFLRGMLLGPLHQWHREEGAGWLPFLLCHAPSCSDTYRISRVPGLSTVSSITYRALNDKDNTKIWAILCETLCSLTTVHLPLPSNRRPGRYLRPHTAQEV